MRFCTYLVTFFAHWFSAIHLEVCSFDCLIAVVTIHYALLLLWIETIENAKMSNDNLSWLVLHQHFKIMMSVLNTNLLLKCFMSMIFLFAGHGYLISMNISNWILASWSNYLSVINKPFFGYQALAATAYVPLIHGVVLISRG